MTYKYVLHLSIHWLVTPLFLYALIIKAFPVASGTRSIREETELALKIETLSVKEEILIMLQQVLLDNSEWLDFTCALTPTGQQIILHESFRDS